MKLILRSKFIFVATSIVFVSACTTGKLYYTNDVNDRILACDVEFVGLPSVDKFAVEYALSLCAHDAVRKGYKLDADQEYLLQLNTAIRSAPCGESWNHDLAEKEYDEGRLSKKEYGYIVAYIDLGLAKVNQC